MRVVQVFVLPLVMPAVPTAEVLSALPVLQIVLVALRTPSKAFGDVRTTVPVPVSLRGTVWWFASAAVCGVTPTDPAA